MRQLAALRPPPAPPTACSALLEEPASQKPHLLRPPAATTAMQPAPWRQSLALALKASEGDITGHSSHCSLPCPSASTRLFPVFLPLSGAIVCMPIEITNYSIMRIATLVPPPLAHPPLPSPCRSDVGHARFRRPPANHPPSYTPRAHCCIQVIVFRSSSRFVFSLVTLNELQIRGFVGDGHLTFVTDARSSKASIPPRRHPKASRSLRNCTCKYK